MTAGVLRLTLLLFAVALISCGDTEDPKDIPAPASLIPATALNVPLAEGNALESRIGARIYWKSLRKTAWEIIRHARVEEISPGDVAMAAFVAPRLKALCPEAPLPTGCLVSVTNESAVIRDHRDAAIKHFEIVGLQNLVHPTPHRDSPGGSWDAPRVIPFAELDDALPIKGPFFVFSRVTPSRDQVDQAHAKGAAGWFKANAPEGANYEGAKRIVPHEEIEGHEGGALPIPVLFVHGLQGNALEYFVIPQKNTLRLALLAGGVADRKRERILVSIEGPSPRGRVLVTLGAGRKYTPNDFASRSALIASQIELASRLVHLAKDKRRPWIPSGRIDFVFDFGVTESSHDALKKMANAPPYFGVIDLGLDLPDPLDSRDLAIHCENPSPQSLIASAFLAVSEEYGGRRESWSRVAYDADADPIAREVAEGLGQEALPRVTLSLGRKPGARQVTGISKTQRRRPALLMAPLAHWANGNRADQAETLWDDEMVPSVARTRLLGIALMRIDASWSHLE